MIRLVVRTLTLVRAACSTASLPFQRGASAGPLLTFLWIGALSFVASACAPDRPLAPLTEKPVALVKLAASMAAYPQVSAGDLFNCAVKPDATLACWGDNSSGQSTPPTGTFTQVSGGVRYACAVKTDGTLACWGSNQFGGIAPRPTGTFMYVSAGGGHTCALKTDQTLACWGSNDFGQATPSPSFFTQVSAGVEHTCAVKTDQTIDCWGWNRYGGATPPMTGTFTQVSAGGGHTCALKTDQTIACWGWNAEGQATPPEGTFTQVEAGWNHTCAVRTDQRLDCWGWNESGQATPPAGTFTQVSAGLFHTCAVKTDGTLACWGRNDYGQATVPSLQDTTAPETAITAANDGNGTALSSGASTLSSAVTIAFGGSDAVGVTGFECSIDAVPYSLCASPVTYSGLPVGTHVFRVRALDSAGNLDLSPASIIWAVITPSTAIGDLIKSINSMGLARGASNSLTGPLGEGSELLNDGNPNNDGAVCNKLDAFLTQVGIKEGNGQLTAVQASQLRIAATAIKRSLGC